MGYRALTEKEKSIVLQKQKWFPKNESDPEAPYEYDGDDAVYFCLHCGKKFPLIKVKAYYDPKKDDLWIYCPQHPDGCNGTLLDIIPWSEDWEAQEGLQWLEGCEPEKMTL